MHRYLVLIALALCLYAAPAASGNPALEEELQGVIDTFLAEITIAPGLSVYAVCPALHLDWAGAAGM